MNNDNMEVGELCESIPMDDDHESDDDEENDEEENGQEESEVYLPGKKLKDDEELVCDDSAYIMLHQASTGAPCLSFDIIKDHLGDSRETFPLTAYMVAGTQAARTHTNNVIVMKMSNLHRTSKEQDSDAESNSDESDDEEEIQEDKKPIMTCALIKHAGCVNRIRSTNIKNTAFVATWSELGKVAIYNLSEQLNAVEDENVLQLYASTSNSVKPVFSFAGHQQEGFALDWCQTTPGMLATGDCRRDVHIWKPNEAGIWTVDQRPLVGHKDSVEDIQWSPNESNVLATCSVDKSIRIWDCRAAPSKACMLTCEDAHLSDINVISWNKNEPLIASGGDDGFLHIWDLRQFQTSKSPVATFKHHTDHITTVEWSPRESTILATGGDDDQIALWDLSLEKDTDNISAEDNIQELNNLPPQLLFIHQGQKEIKELHWHPQIPGCILSTAHSGFNIFRTISV